MKCQASVGAELATSVSHEREHQCLMNANIDRRSIRRIASTDEVGAPWSNAAAVTRFLAAPHRLPTFLGGLTTAVRALVRAGIDESVLTDAEAESPGRHAPAYDRARRQRERDPQTAFARRMGLGLLSTVPPTVRDELARGVAWVALALYESATPTVRLDPAASPDAASPRGVATIEVDYHLILAAGSKTPPTAGALSRGSGIRRHPSPRISSAGSVCRRAMRWSSAWGCCLSASSSMTSAVR